MKLSLGKRPTEASEASFLVEYFTTLDSDTPHGLIPYALSFPEILQARAVNEEMPLQRVTVFNFSLFDINTLEKQQGDALSFWSIPDARFQVRD